MILSYSILTTSFIQKLFVVPIEKILFTMYHCVTIKHIKTIDKKMIMNLIITQILFGNIDFKETYQMSNSED